MSYDRVKLNKIMKHSTYLIFKLTYKFSLYSQNDDDFDNNADAGWQ